MISKMMGVYAVPKAYSAITAQSQRKRDSVVVQRAQLLENVTHGRAEIVQECVQFGVLVVHLLRERGE
jgi:hypothetical protein